MNRKTINKKVNVTAVYFRQGLKTYPKRIEFDGSTYTFEEDGLHYNIQKGENSFQLFDMTDGVTTFRLRTEDHAGWTLVSMT